MLSGERVALVTSSAPKRRRGAAMASEASRQASCSMPSSQPSRCCARGTAAGP